MRDTNLTIILDGKETGANRTRNFENLQLGTKSFEELCLYIHAFIFVNLLSCFAKLSHELQRHFAHTGCWISNLYTCGNRII